MDGRKKDCEERGELRMARRFVSEWRGRLARVTYMDSEPEWQLIEKEEGSLYTRKVGEEFVLRAALVTVEKARAEAVKSMDDHLLTDVRRAESLAGLQGVVRMAAVIGMPVRNQ